MLCNRLRTRHLKVYILEKYETNSELAGPGISNAALLSLLNFSRKKIKKKSRMPHTKSYSPAVVYISSFRLIKSSVNNCIIITFKPLNSLE